jgi:hypothetical protein
MKRISLPLFAVLALGVVASGQAFKYTSQQGGQQSWTKDRSPASVGSAPSAASNLYGKVFDAWTNIPSVCKEDFPLTEFQKSQCDGFWRTFLTRVVLAGFPFFVVFILFQAWAHTVKRSYQRAASRIARRKVSAIGEVVTEASVDTYSWALGLRPFRVKTGDQVVVAYLEKHAEPGQTVHLYEAGHWFGQMKHVAVKVA